MAATRAGQELVLVLLEPPAGLPWGPDILFFKFINIYIYIYGYLWALGLLLGWTADTFLTNEGVIKGQGRAHFPVKIC